MSAMDLATAMWNDDGHVLHLTLDKSAVHITGTTCPKGVACAHPRVGCLVDYFVNRFGLELNVGSCAPAPDIEIAWMSSGDTYDVDSCQVWIIPMDDPVFAAWRSTQTPDPA
jgi:hypothetical protein